MLSSTSVLLFLQDSSPPQIPSVPSNRWRVEATLISSKQKHAPLSLFVFYFLFSRSLVSFLLLHSSIFLLFTLCLPFSSSTSMLVFFSCTSLFLFHLLFLSSLLSLSLPDCLFSAGSQQHNSHLSSVETPSHKNKNCEVIIPSLSTLSLHSLSFIPTLSL